MQKLILFDIDGTLLRCGPQVRPLFVDALRAVFGTHGSLEGFDFGGKTDPRIVLDLVTESGQQEDEVLSRLPDMRREYLQNLKSGLQRDKMLLLPGVLQLLESLAQRQDILLGLLTGNWKDGAAIKLSHFDLNRFFSFGAFGDDGVERRSLVPVAMRRAAKIRGSEFQTDEVLIIGDTLRDIDCAKAAGVRCLAVATGFTPAERLRQAGAEWVHNTLEEAHPAMLAFHG